MTIKIASLPGRGNFRNPYVDLFYDALEPHSIELIDELKTNFNWLKSHSDNIDAIHLHWPEGIWRTYGVSTQSSRIRSFIFNNIKGGWHFFEYYDFFNKFINKLRFYIFFKKTLGVLHFYRFLKLTKKLNIKIIWTFHNEESHEGDDYLDIMGNKILSKYVDLVICHSKLSQVKYCNRYTNDVNVVVMHHGNYDGIYPTARPRKIVLEELGLRLDLPVVSCLGLLRNYKGVNIACEAVALLEGKVQFICAGRPYSSFNLPKFQEQINNTLGSVLIPTFISDQQFSDFASASDIVLLPYTKITGSGALLAAISFSRGVITSDLPYFREVLDGNSNAGRLVPQGDSVSLSKEIEQYLLLNPSIRNQAARDLADKYDWNLVVIDVVNALNKMCK